MSGINIYCDESCHLEHDKSNYMVLGGISCPKHLRKQISTDIRNLKTKYGLSKFNEIKWQSISKNKLEFYLELVNYFFSNENLSFRAIIVDKTQVVLENNLKFIDFYYKMYFYVLSGLIKPLAENYIYLDKVDSKSSHRIHRLHQILCNDTYDFDMKNIINIQNIASFESEILQLADLFIGAISYINRGLNSSDAKLAVIQRIIEKSGYDLKKSTLLGEGKFNIFKIKLQERAHDNY